MKKKYFAGVLAPSIFLFALGCASSERKVAEVSPDAALLENPGEQITPLAHELAEAKRQGVNVLSPTWFEGAEKSLARAKDLRDGGGDKAKVAKEITESRAKLQKAREVSISSERLLSDVLQTREQAWSAFQGAKTAGSMNLKSLNNDYEKAEGDLTTLTKAVEDNDLEAVTQKKEKVHSRYRALLTKATNKESLDAARGILDQSKKEGGKKYAPKTLAYAENLVQATDTLIAQRPLAREEIEKKSKEAVFHANRALQLTRQGKQFSDQSPEEIALWVEDTFHGIGQELQVRDSRDRTFVDQAAVIKASAKNVSTQQRTLAQEKSSWEMQASQLKSNVSSLSAEVEATEAQKERLLQVSKKFDPAEVEILHKGGKLVLRLKAMTFPSGDSKIGPEKFSLLSRVSGVLKQYPEAQVVVEGHTDATGGAAKNARLSQARAEAVRQYLVSNNELNREKTAALGKGDKEPIAPNKTAEGRQANRRIEVVITPGATQVAE